MPSVLNFQTFCTTKSKFALAPPPVDLVVTVIRAPLEPLYHLDAAVDFILPLSPTSPSKAGSRNPPPPFSPLLIQLCMVSKMTVYGEQLGDDAMGLQGSEAGLAGMLAGGVWFRVVRSPVEVLYQLDAAVDFILPLSPTSPSKAGSRNPPPPFSPLLIQLCTVSKMTTYGEQLGDDAMGIQGCQVGLAGMLAGGVWFRFETLYQLVAAVDFILPLSPTSPSKAGSCNPPSQLSPLLIQLCTVSKMTVYGEQLGDDAMGVQGSQAGLVGMLAGGVWFRVVRGPVIIPADVDASVLHSAVLGGFDAGVVRPF